MLIGLLFFIISAFVLFVLLKMLLKLVTSTCSENFLTKRLRADNQYTLVVMRFLLESCLEIGLCALITVTMIDGETFSSFWESVSTSFAFLCLLGLAIAPIVFSRYVKKYLNDAKQLADPKLSKYAKLFQGYRVNKVALRYQIIFFLRRYFMLLILTQLPMYAMWQVRLQMVSTMYVVA